jgi:hypothetical protein
MTSADSKSPNPGTATEGGGMLPALLAGVGILLVAGLFIFGGDDDKVATEGDKPGAASANARTAKGPSSGVAARNADKANETSRPKPRLNPRIANAVVTEGMAPEPGKKKTEPTSFPSSAEEIAYWEEELRAAESNLEVRQRAVDHAPKTEEAIRQNGSAEDLAAFQKRLVIVDENFAQAKARVEEVEEKLAALRGF